eukprot:CAMPEP_0113667622 /NCGR_PEP_ID=MMETSP0038_2-20120614/3543_1 /TAXON_ID=2898 /ORGANISM="Cryptomonas paramecium" /LENGTH=75 /DNA_ID=CAMNT_0000583267 /DNA_START=165 /DNA_END=392 /DNA_ORIENTATION=+ /assembly_acc=CAM_ASM_000170
MADQNAFDLDMNCMFEGAQCAGRGSMLAISQGNNSSSDEFGFMGKQQDILQLQDFRFLTLMAPGDPQLQLLPANL